jgi:hypothetical protein
MGKNCYEKEKISTRRPSTNFKYNQFKLNYKQML